MSQSPNADSMQPSSLAALLAESYQELESIRKELTATKKQAERAERLSSSLQALYSSVPDQQQIDPSEQTLSSSSPSPNAPFPESATRILMDFEDRAVRAEIARDEAEARKRVLMDTWSQLDSYLLALSEAAADARAGYGRIVSEGGGQLVLAQIPTLPGGATPKHHRRTPIVPAITLPANPYTYPQPQHAGTRRPRTPSMDGYQQPPSKRSRGEDRDRDRDRDRSAYIGESVCRATRYFCSRFYFFISFYYSTMRLSHINLRIKGNTTIQIHTPLNTHIHHRPLLHTSAIPISPLRHLPTTPNHNHKHKHA